MIGGGPAGMMAAQTLVQRGHSVKLYEKSDRLGGLLNDACLVPFKNTDAGISGLGYQRNRQMWGGNSAEYRSDGGFGEKKTRMPLLWQQVLFMFSLRFRG